MPDYGFFAEYVIYLYCSNSERHKYKCRSQKTATMTRTKSSKQTSETVAFRYIHPITDQEYVGQARISWQGFNEDYEGGESVRIVDLINVWHVDDLGGHTKQEKFERWFEIQLEAAAEFAYLYPPAKPVLLPADWDEENLVVVTKVQAVMNVTTKNPLPTSAPGFSEKIDSVVPLHIPGENAYVITTTCPPSEAIEAIRKMAKLSA